MARVLWIGIGKVAGVGWQYRDKIAHYMANGIQEKMKFNSFATDKLLKIQSELFLIFGNLVKQNKIPSSLEKLSNF